jgi:hypothetical protein
MDARATDRGQGGTCTVLPPAYGARYFSSPVLNTENQLSPIFS